MSNDTTKESDAESQPPILVWRLMETPPDLLLIIFHDDKEIERVFLKHIKSFLVLIPGTAFSDASALAIELGMLEGEYSTFGYITYQSRSYLTMVTMRPLKGRRALSDNISEEEARRLRIKRGYIP